MLWTDADLVGAVKAWKTYGNTSKAAESLGCSQRALQRRLKAAREKGLHTVAEGIQDLLDRRCQSFARKSISQHSEYVVDLEEDRPFAIVHFGDPHLDDDGCDLPLLREHVRIVQETPGMLGSCVGDFTNNWSGKLTRLWAEQGTNATEAWQLAEWFVTAVPWAYLVFGNHDLFHGPGHGALKFIARQADVMADAPHEVKLQLNLPNVKEPIRIWARHQWPGRSMWHPLHGQIKASQMGGFPADIVIGGHIHTWGEQTCELSNGMVSHLIQVGTYKRHDDFAAAKGYTATHYGSSVVTVINPKATGPSRVKVLWDVAEAAEYLTWLRARL